jgi:hypothetical protein
MPTGWRRSGPRCATCCARSATRGHDPPPAARRRAAGADREPRRHGRRARGGARAGAPVIQPDRHRRHRHRGAGEGDAIVVSSPRPKAATDDRTCSNRSRSSAAASTRSARASPRSSARASDRILIQVPGIGSAAELKALIGTTAQLTFHPVVSRTTDPTPRRARATRSARRSTRRGFLRARTDPGGHRRGTDRRPARLSTRTAGRR